MSPALSYCRGCEALEAHSSCIRAARHQPRITRHVYKDDGISVSIVCICGIPSPSLSLSTWKERLAPRADYVGIFVALKPLYVLSFYCSSP